MAGTHSEDSYAAALLHRGRAVGQRAGSAHEPKGSFLLPVPFAGRPWSLRQDVPAAWASVCWCLRDTARLDGPNRPSRLRPVETAQGSEGAPGSQAQGARPREH